MDLYLLVSAADGYRTVFALAEVDPALGGRAVLITDQRDGGPHPADHGPYRLLVPADQRAARWVRQVKAIELLKPGVAPTACGLSLPALKPR